MSEDIATLDDATLTRFTGADRGTGSRLMFQITRDGRYVQVTPEQLAFFAGVAGENQLIDRICAQFAETHDTSELWVHMRRDPEAFRTAVRRALRPVLVSPAP